MDNGEGMVNDTDCGVTGAELFEEQNQKSCERVELLAPR